MKKKVMFFLCGVICFSVIIGMIGFVKNKRSIGNEQVTTEEVSSSVAVPLPSCHGYGCIGIR